MAQKNGGSWSFARRDGSSLIPSLTLDSSKSMKVIAEKREFNPLWELYKGSPRTFCLNKGWLGIYPQALDPLGENCSRSINYPLLCTHTHTGVHMHAYTYIHMNLVCVYTPKAYMNCATQWQLKSDMSLCILAGALSRISYFPENHLPCCPKPHEKSRCILYAKMPIPVDTT